MSKPPLIQIPTRKRRCDTTDKLFSPLETIYSVLLEENKILIRKDYSEEGWKKALDEHPNLSKNPNWTSQKTKAKNKASTGYPPEQIERLMEIANEAISMSEPKQKLRALFILGFLLRKKLILPLPQVTHKRIKCSIYQFHDKEYIFPSQLLLKKPSSDIVDLLKNDFSLSFCES